MELLRVQSPSKIQHVLFRRLCWLRWACRHNNSDDLLGDLNFRKVLSKDTNPHLFVRQMDSSSSPCNSYPNNSSQCRNIPSLATAI